MYSDLFKEVSLLRLHRIIEQVLISKHNKITEHDLEHLFTQIYGIDSEQLLLLKVEKSTNSTDSYV